MIELTTKDAAFAQAMRMVVARRGRDYVFPEEWRDKTGMCQYVRPDGLGAGCLMGAALNLVGWSLDRLSENEGNPVRDLLEDNYSQLLCEAATEAQTLQDENATWGEALAVFENILGGGQ